MSYSQEIAAVQNVDLNSLSIADLAFLEELHERKTLELRRSALEAAYPAWRDSMTAAEDAIVRALETRTVTVREHERNILVGSGLDSDTTAAAALRFEDIIAPEVEASTELGLTFGEQFQQEMDRQQEESVDEQIGEALEAAPSLADILEVAYKEVAAQDASARTEQVHSKHQYTKRKFTGTGSSHKRTPQLVESTDLVGNVRLFSSQHDAAAGTGVGQSRISAAIRSGRVVNGYSFRKVAK